MVVENEIVGCRPDSPLPDSPLPDARFPDAQFPDARFPDARLPNRSYLIPLFSQQLDHPFFSSQVAGTYSKEGGFLFG